MALQLALIGVGVFALTDIFRHDRLWEGDGPVHYTGFFLARGEERGRLYQPALQRQVQARLLEASASGERRQYRDGYLPFNTPPHVAVLGSPLGALPLETFLWSWTLFQMALLVWLLFQLLGLTRHWTWPERVFLLAAVLGAVPVFRSLQYGQWSLLLSVALLSAYRHLRRGQDLRAGALWTLCTIKPQLALLTGLGAAVARPRFLAGALAVAGIWLGVTLAWLGPGVFPSYLEMLGQGMSAEGEFGYWPRHMVNLRGLLAGVTGGGGWGGVIALSLLGFAAAALGTIQVARRWGPAGGERFALGFSVVALLGMFFSPHLQVHDATLAVLPCLLLYDGLRRRPRAAFAFAALMTAAPLAFLADAAWPDNPLRLAPLWLGGVLAWALWEWRRRRPTPEPPAADVAPAAPGRQESPTPGAGA